MQSKWTTYGKRWSAAAGVLLVLTGCKKRIGMTTVEVPDSVRHYYPVIAGQELNLVYDLTNTGDQPLIIRDIQPSCGCIVTMPESRMVLPDKTIRLKFVYQSAKNIGYVQHVIRIYGNIKPKGMAKLVFDVNVVPHADYTRDYEELGTLQGGRGTQRADKRQGGRRGQRAGLLRGHREGQPLARAVSVEGGGQPALREGTREKQMYLSTNHQKLKEK